MRGRWHRYDQAFGAEMTEEILPIKMKEQGQCWVPTVAVYKSLERARGIIADVIAVEKQGVAENQRKPFKGNEIV